MGSVCPKRPPGVEKRVKRVAAAPKMHDEEKPSQKSSNSTAQLREAQIAKKRYAVDVQKVEDVGQPKVVGKYVIHDEWAEIEKKKREEVFRIAQLKEREKLKEIEGREKEKTNKADKFVNRWSEEINRRGVSSNEGYSDPTALVAALTSALNPTFQSEISKNNSDFEGGISSTNNSNYDTIKTDYLLPVIVSDFVSQINEMRTNPAKYATMIKSKYLNMIDTMLCHKITMRQYSEGKASIRDAVKCLEGLTATGSLTADAALCVTAHIQAKRQAFERKVYGPDRELEMKANLKRFGTSQRDTLVLDCNLNVSTLNYQDIVANLMISDGDLTRRNRQCLTRSDAVKVGVGIYQRNQRAPIFCTIILAGSSFSGNKSIIATDLLNDSGASGL